jgi:hypothetical protein
VQVLVSITLNYRLHYHGESLYTLGSNNMHKYSVRANYYCLEQSTFYKEPVLDKEKVSTLASSVPDPAVKFLSIPDL